MTVSRRPLHDGWTVIAERGPVPREIAEAGAIPAQVPGSIHPDLSAAGLIPDPYLDENTLVVSIGQSGETADTVAKPWQNAE